MLNNVRAGAVWIKEEESANNSAKYTLIIQA
jgi:hypothetical protein